MTEIAASRANPTCRRCVMLFHGLLIRSDLNRKLLLLSGVLFVLFFVSLLKVWIFKRIIREARKRFGILEKHKDYIIRANAYHKKQETLKVTITLSVFNSISPMIILSRLC